MNSSLISPSVQWIEVDSEHAGQRIDNFLFARLKGVPKSHVYRILRTGEVRRNGGRVKAQDRLDSGDVVRLPPIRVAERESVELPLNLIRGRIEPRILYEDDDLLVLNKPSGMAVHGGSGLSYGVIEALRELRPQARSLELVHRLDRETSGCLLIAKKRSALKSLHEQFRDDDVNKVYVALLAGQWAKTRLMVDAPLKKNVLQSGERMVRVARDGKSAMTEFKRLARYAEATLVEARPITGRTHQIRVHALHMGHALAGDDRYGDEATNRRFRQSGLKRLFLHAAHTTFRHPRTGDAVKVEAPLDSELADFLKNLPK
ncbi:MAG: 23S rRNA pseudouridine(955/2504/2580) synthase RluC [Methylococcaceae bacterium]|nr:23S rRNA pseudouridine(955/2504/2580) synthase RluC [Methylococcaceae bacterium]